MGFRSVMSWMFWEKIVESEIEHCEENRWEVVTS